MAARPRVVLYNYGSPRVGNKAFAEEVRCSLAGGSKLGWSVACKSGARRDCSPSFDMTQT